MEKLVGNSHLYLSHMPRCLSVSSSIISWLKGVCFKISWIVFSMLALSLTCLVGNLIMLSIFSPNYFCSTTGRIRSAPSSDCWIHLMSLTCRLVLVLFLVGVLRIRPDAPRSAGHRPSSLDKRGTGICKTQRKHLSCHCPIDRAPFVPRAAPG